MHINTVSQWWKETTSTSSVVTLHKKPSCS